MTSIKFTIPGEPHALQRARHTRSGVVYDPSANTKAKNRVAEAAQKAMQARKPFEGPVRLTAIYVLSWPAGTPQKRKSMSNGLYREKRPDLDNYDKWLLDGLTLAGNVWKDDAQVAMKITQKVMLDSGPFTSVTIEPLWEVDGVEVFS